MWRLKLLHHFLFPFFLFRIPRSQWCWSTTGREQPGRIRDVLGDFSCKLGLFSEHSSSLHIQGTKPNRNIFFLGANLSLPQNFRCHIWTCIYKIFILNRDNLWNSTGWALLNIINFAGQADVFMYNFHCLLKPFFCSILFAAQKCLESAQQLPAHPRRCQAPSPLCKNSDCSGHARAVPKSHPGSRWESLTQTGAALGSCCHTKLHPNHHGKSFQCFHKALGAR